MSAKEASHIDPKSGLTISKVANFGGLEEFEHALRSAEKSLEVDSNDATVICFEHKSLCRSYTMSI
jgi:hypothetical protein